MGGSERGTEGREGESLKCNSCLNDQWFTSLVR